MVALNMYRLCMACSVPALGVGSPSADMVAACVGRGGRRERREAEGKAEEEAEAEEGLAKVP